MAYADPGAHVCPRSERCNSAPSVRILLASLPPGIQIRTTTPEFTIWQFDHAGRVPPSTHPIERRRTHADFRQDFRKFQGRRASHTSSHLCISGGRDRKAGKRIASRPPRRVDSYVRFAPPPSAATANRGNGPHNPRFRKPGIIRYISRRRRRRHPDGLHKRAIGYPRCSLQGRPPGPLSSRTGFSSSCPPWTTTRWRNAERPGTPDDRGGCRLACTCEMFQSCWARHRLP